MLQMHLKLLFFSRSASVRLHLPPQENEYPVAEVIVWAHYPSSLGIGRLAHPVNAAYDPF
ncbi:hypothetical protein [Paenibacillus vortex]|uniref:hypothetical protein n=1 Tax=Paenibacillus vortex TaxID=71995 RepID=UPI0002F2BAEC|nr:hypothetical protein [Paenibacillus vortex]